MKIFDLHADIGWDILRHKELNETNILQTYHLDKLASGQVEGVGVACFFDGSEDWARMQEMVLAVKEEMQLNQDANRITWIRNKEDLQDTSKPQLIMTVEGMCGIVDDVKEKIQWLYNQGVRIASLCWNEENTLATGVKGTVTRGLSNEGREAVAKMNELGMVLDVSHTNEKTFWDLIEVSTRPLIATHSNTRVLCEVHRNLTDQQIMAIASSGGVIGLNAAKNFIDSNSTLQDSRHLAKHGRYIADLVGVQHLAIGFDFMDFLDGHTTSMASDLIDATQAQNLMNNLQAEGFNEQEMQQIGYKNVIALLETHLK